MDMFIKTVITADTDAGEVEEAARLTASVNPDILFILQPNFFDMKEGSVKRCHDLLPVCRKFLSDVRILPQMHKMLKVR
jgi:organic radical activating enzyme